MNPHRMKETAIAVVAAAALAAGLAACGDDSSTADAASPSAAQTASNGDVFNAADVQFATDMIPHHAQAIEMVTLTDGRPLDPEIEQLANQIREAQGPEVEVMVDWLMAWGEDVPATSLDHANAGHGEDDSHDGGGHASGGSSMPGMMSQDDMTALADASDEEFQTMWLEMMIEHHAGAIEMARAEQEDGEFDDAVSLAEQIEASQAEEIERMETLLGS